MNDLLNSLQRELTVVEAKVIVLIQEGNKEEAHQMADKAALLRQTIELIAQGQ